MFEDLNPLTCSPSELLAWLDGMAPGVLALSLLVSLDASALSPEDAVTYVQVHERIGSWWPPIRALTTNVLTYTVRA
jgi:hypothetical protein